MVKADPKHDYYADLELPTNADTEAIKRQFKILAKRYHPDRNPGREIECVPKFQAVQAAHEVLSDPSQKQKYDIDRAKLNKPPEQPAPYPDSYIYKRPQKPPPPPPSNFPPPPKRNGVPPTNQFGTAGGRPNSSPSAKKFAEFTKAAPQQWDRSKFEDAARAEALRNLHNMRSPSQHPPRPPPRAPTAAKSGSTAPSPDIPPASGPPPGFPGLSRTNSGRRAGFSPATPGSDELPASSTSAYAYVHRADRPPQPAAAYPAPQPPPPSKSATPNPPSMNRPRPSMSPLRQSKSSGFEEAQRPGLSRSSSRYATSGGERTDLNGPGLMRSASVRNTSNQTQWGESGPFGNRQQAQAQSQNGFKVPPPPPRHHSSSPKSRSKPKAFHLSASETSSSESEPVAYGERPKATPRKARPQQPSTRSHLDNDPALTGQFPSNNYNKINEDKQYHYPPPDPSGAPNHRSFVDIPNSFDDITQGLNNAGIRHVHRDDVPLKKYGSPFSLSRYPKPWISVNNARVYNMNSCMINGVPSWVLPSNVYPKSNQSAHNDFPAVVKAPLNGYQDFQRGRHFVADPFIKHADIYLSQNPRRFNGSPTDPHSATPNANGNATFSAADWNDKFSNNENVFRPDESISNNRSKSPPKQRGPKLPNRGRTMPRKQDDREDDSSANEDIGTKMAGVRHVPGSTDGQSKAAAFKHGSFSTEDWAEKLRSQNDSNAAKGFSYSKPSSKDANRQPNVHDEVEVEEHPSPTSTHSQPIPKVNVEPDAMDVDESIPRETDTTTNGDSARPASAMGPRRPSSGGVNLNTLGETTPFKPSAGGLSDFEDFKHTLPFDSRAADELNLHQPPSSGPAARHLNLPKPPKPVLPPDEMHLSQENWSRYSEKMVRYMHDWNVFNCKMIDHFRTRQEQITLSMYHNWVTAVGDGASADDFDGLDFVGENDNGGGPDDAGGNSSSHHKPKKAGYATYMQWLEQDRVCRTWWDVAFDEHTACMEDLGRIRRVVKDIRAREFGKNG